MKSSGVLKLIHLYGIAYLICYVTCDQDQFLGILHKIRLD